MTGTSLVACCTPFRHGLNAESGARCHRCVGRAVRLSGRPYRNPQDVTLCGKKSGVHAACGAIRGVSPEPWGLAREAILKELHLMPGDEPLGPICKAPTADGDFTKRAETISEASSMLNAFLEIEGSLTATTSHCLKATTLVWSARYGMDDKCRAMLGHHALKEHSLACYSRDMLVKPLRELSGMLFHIQQG
eukprot:s326_g8.t1